MQPRDLAALADTALFEGIEVLALDELIGTVPSSVREYGEGSLMLTAGMRYESLWILVEGSVSAEMQGPSGKVVRIETIAAPEPLASAILFAPEPVLPVSVRARSSVRVVCVPRDSVLSMCQHSRKFLENLLRDSGTRVASLSERFRLLQFASLRVRLAVWLLARAGAEDEVMLPASKERMAETFGVTRPSLSRELAAMARDGLIRMEGRRIAILRRAELAELVAED